MIWILDSFLSFDLVIEEILMKKWQFLGYRLLIYAIAFYCYKITAIFGVCFTSGMLLLAIHHFLQRLISSHQTKFKFQALPLPIQQRFYELQSPLIRYRLPKAYFNKALIKSYNQLYIDNLILDKRSYCFKLFDSFIENFGLYSYMQMAKKEMQLIRDVNYICNIYECKCSTKLLKNLIVIKKIRIDMIPVSFNEFPILNNLNLKELEIVDCYLNVNKLQLISQLKLQYIKLRLNDDGTEYLTKMNEMLEASKRSTVINLKYSKKCENRAEFEDFLLQWLQINRYERRYKGNFFYVVLIQNYAKDVYVTV